MSGQKAVLRARADKNETRSAPHLEHVRDQDSTKSVRSPRPRAHTARLGARKDSQAVPTRQVGDEMASRWSFIPAARQSRIARNG